MRFDYREVDTREKLLDCAWEYFSKTTEKCRVYRENGLMSECSYRANGDPKAEHTCIVGAFIPDEDIVGFDGEVIRGGLHTLCVSIRNKAVAQWLNRFSIELGQMQNIHDNHLPKEWTEGLKRIFPDYTPPEER